MFREKYKKDNEMINPSNDFLENLKVEMKKEEAKNHNYRFSNNKKILLTAATIALVVIGITTYNKIFNIQRNNIIQSAEVSDSSQMNESENGLFSNSKWYDQSLSNEEIYDIFIKRLSSPEDLKELSTSNSNEFTNSEVIKKSDVEKLVDLLENASLIEGEKYSEENPTYYMASFKNGDIIKFTIYNNRYFECNDFEGQYLIPEK